MPDQEPQDQIREVIKENLAKRGATGRVAEEIFTHYANPNTVRGGIGFRMLGHLEGTTGEDDTATFGVSLKIPEHVSGNKVVVSFGDSLNAVVSDGTASSRDVLYNIEIVESEPGKVRAAIKQPYEVVLTTQFGGWFVKQLSEISNIVSRYNSK